MISVDIVCKLHMIRLKVLGKSDGLRSFLFEVLHKCKTSKRKDRLYISLLSSVWRITCENFNPNRLTLAEI